MYGVMRERARNRTTQIAGLAVTAAITAGAATLFANGLGNFVGAFTPEGTTLTTIAPETKTAPPPDDFVLSDDDVKLPATKPLITFDNWTFTEKKTDETIAVTGGEIARRGEPGAVATPPKAVRVAPSLRSQEKPPYPASEIRARNQGNTGLELCVDARGRVTSASLRTSSGHARLDEAALRWVRDARFSPGTLDGVAQAVCGHTVVYEWRLEDAR